MLGRAITENEEGKNVNQVKKSYVPPKVVIYGTISDITKAYDDGAEDGQGGGSINLG